MRRGSCKQTNTRTRTRTLFGPRASELEILVMSDNNGLVPWVLRGFFLKNFIRPVVLTAVLAAVPAAVLMTLANIRKGTLSSDVHTYRHFTGGGGVADEPPSFNPAPAPAPPCGMWA